MKIPEELLNQLEDVVSKFSHIGVGFSMLPECGYFPPSVSLIDSSKSRENGRDSFFDTFQSFEEGLLGKCTVERHGVEYHTFKRGEDDD